MELNLYEHNRISGGPNIMPLIDIVFILLIFFMLTSTFLVEEGLEVNLPQAGSSVPLKDSVVTIGIDAAGVIHMGGRIVSMEEMEIRVKAALSENVERPFSIKSDSSVSVKKLVGVIDSLKESGVSSLTIRTERS